MAGVMALVVGVASLAWRQRVHALRLAWALLLVIGSHGFLDAMTESGVGVALAWPLTNARVLLPFQFVPKAPMGSEFPSLEWFRVMGIEAFCFSPLLAYAARPWRGS
jgi:inner membrane protein